MWVPARRFDPEWMDRRDNPADVVEGALGDIRFVNRWLGGSSAILRALDALFDVSPAGRTVEVLDVGTGGGDLPIDMIAHGQRRGRRLTVTAVDRDPAAVAVAGSVIRPDGGGAQVVRADAQALPFGRGSFDLVTASMFLHHFDHDDTVRLLRSFRQIARSAVVINDLRRHRLPWAFIKIFSYVTWRRPMFRHDAPLSVLRGFTVDELTRAARGAGVEAPRIERRWPFRLVLTLPADSAA